MLSWVVHYLPVFLLLLVVLSSFIRHIGRLRLSLWCTMTIAAVIALTVGSISFKEAFYAIDFNVIGYLFGVFVLGSALDKSKLLKKFAFYVIQSTTSQKVLLWRLIFVFGFLSALLLNDTMAVVGAAVALIFIRYYHVAGKAFIYATAFSVTIGSVMSPVGNPQNLLIANYFDRHVFLYFFAHLVIPTLISLAICYWVLSYVFKRDLAVPITGSITRIKIHKKRIKAVLWGLALFIILILLKIIINAWSKDVVIPFACVSLLPALVILWLTPNKKKVLKSIDWRILVFFVSMFILIAAVWKTGVFQMLLDGKQSWFSQPVFIIIMALALSQVVSNAPMVVLLLPFIGQVDTVHQGLLSLAVGSTFAGNLTLFGAASNIIVFQAAMKRGIDCFSARSFFIIGVMISIPSLLVYYLFLT
ncbi:SLC13 family permease [Facilibium subflavum]|uniref:SLC13 family permease n=1 Tax=Facilibium subflavum TaxID=2219058 RepID=UPI0013C355DB|nr:SLC13 family permease [Facilibium subflavum]